MVYNAGRRLGAPSGEEAFVSRRCLLLITPHWSPESQPAILKRNKKVFQFNEWEKLLSSLMLFGENKQKQFCFVLSAAVLSFLVMWTLLRAVDR